MNGQRLNLIDGRPSMRMRMHIVSEVIFVTLSNMFSFIYFLKKNNIKLLVMDIVHLVRSGKLETVFPSFEVSGFQECSYRYIIKYLII